MGTKNDANETGSMIFALYCFALFTETSSFVLRGDGDPCNSIATQDMYDCVRTELPIFTAKDRSYDPYDSYPFYDSMQMRAPMWSSGNPMMGELLNPFPELYSSRLSDRSVML